MRFPQAVLWLVLICPFPVRAVNYYVDSTGSDANSGTSLDKAFVTMSKAAAMVAPGDSVFVSAGTYTAEVAPGRSGTPDAPIVFMACGDSEAVITTAASDFGFDLTDRSWIIIDGFTFRDAYGWIQIEGGGHHNLFRNLTFDGAGNYHCVKIMGGCYNTIAHCRFLRAKDGDLDVDLADYVGLWMNSHFNLVEYCEFGRITHNAYTELQYLSQYTPSHNMVRRCTFTDLGHRGTESGASNHSVIEKNVFTGMAGEMIRMSGRRMVVRDNLLAHDEPEPTGCETAWDAMILMRSHQNEYNNVADTRYTRVYNNTFYDCTNDYAVVVRPFRLMLDNIFKNNIFHNNNNLLYMITPLETQYQDYYFTGNILRDRTAGENMIRHGSNYYTFTTAHTSLSGYYAGNWETDPLMVDDAGDDFHLTAGSPAVNTGLDLAQTKGAGSGTEVPVDDPLYFVDGFGLVGGDEIMVGADGPATVVGVDYVRNVLKLDRPLSWGDGDPVNRVHAGSGNDLGAFEYGRSDLRVDCARLKNAREGEYYYTHFEAAEGVAPYAWELTSGSMPAGLTLKPSGEVEGIPNAAGSHSLDVRVTDSVGTTAERTVTLDIDSAATFILTFEAESGSIAAAYQEGSDAGASGGAYLYCPEGTGRVSDPDPEVFYDLDVPATGLYYVWLRMYGTGGGNRRTFAFVNEDSARRVNPTVYDEWVWAGTGDEAVALNYGHNSLCLGHGDELARIDMILVTDDRDYVPASSAIVPRPVDLRRVRTLVRDLPNPCPWAEVRRLLEEHPGIELSDVRGNPLRGRGIGIIRTGAGMRMIIVTE